MYYGSAAVDSPLDLRTFNRGTGNRWKINRVDAKSCGYLMACHVIADV